MKKALIILVLLAVAVAIYAMGTGKGSDTALAPTAETPTQEAGKKMAFSAFLASNKDPYRCTVDQYLNDMDSDGVVFIADGKVAGDFTTIAEGKPMDTSFVMKDGYQYVWSSAAPMGVKIPISTTASADASAAASGTYSWNAEQIGEYDCQPWAATDAAFALPANVSFTELSR